MAFGSVEPEQNAIEKGGIVRNIVGEQSTYQNDKRRLVTPSARRGVAWDGAPGRPNFETGKGSIFPDASLGAHGVPVARLTF